MTAKAQNILVRGIYCIGRNYGAHARELGNAIPSSPVVFLKSPSAVRGFSDAGAIAWPEETFHHEVELVLRIGNAKRTPDTDLLDLVDAVALGLDLTRREVQTRLKKEGLPWTEAKSFRGAAILTEFVALPAAATGEARLELLRNCEFRLWVNGEERQHGSPRDMIFDPGALLRFIDSSHGLYPGDILFTGTPEGVGPLRRGDSMRAQLMIDGHVAIDEKGTL